MTRKDYEMIASALRASDAPENVCRVVASTLAEENPRFDSGRFMSACGVVDLTPRPSVRRR